MSIRQMVADSLAATELSNQQKKLAGQLASQARQAIGDRARQHATDFREEIGIPGDVIVTEWHDDLGKLHQVVVDRIGTVRSVAYTSSRPSGRDRTIHRLTAVPLEHLEEHFGPLMSADFVAQPTS